MPVRKNLEETHNQLQETINSLQTQRTELAASLHATLNANNTLENHTISNRASTQSMQSQNISTQLGQEDTPTGSAEEKDKKQSTDATTVNELDNENDVLEEAQKIVKRHIKLLHSYNEIRDVGQGLLGLIAEARGVRIADLYAEFGLSDKD